STLLNDLKANQGAYWPCVYAIMEQKGMSFSMDLPNRFSLDWNRLTPDFLHMHYRDAFPLNDSFKINEISYGGDQETIDSWCYVSFRGEENQSGHASIEVPLPRRWLAGTGKECFYCGLKNHASAHCPGRTLPPFRSEVWRDMGRVNLDDMGQAFKGLDEPTDSARFVQQVGALIRAEGTIESVLMRGMFSTVAPAQLGMLPVLPRIKNREWPVELEQLNPEEPWPIREPYNTLLAGDLEKAKETLRAVSAKLGRSFEGACLEGFISLESEDPHMAQFYWQEAARIGPSTVQQGYVFFLQARLHEVAGEYKDALGLYRQVRVGSPRWLEPAYREGVCMVKMGFTGQSLEIFGDMVMREPLLFNRLLLDTEIDRGRVHVLSGLRDPWRDA
ncbi:MAG: tetratricopeptide repeat protein, partial [Humidesulfovibrio sp.]|nr:tetratricopeptide repeat protein [Humidesulfovibrio sp.]